MLERELLEPEALPTPDIGHRTKRDGRDFHCARIERRRDPDDDPVEPAGCHRQGTRPRSGRLDRLHHRAR
jgi:hypothetical protein